MCLEKERQTQAEETQQCEEEMAALLQQQTEHLDAAKAKAAKEQQTLEAARRAAEEAQEALHAAQLNVEQTTLAQQNAEKACADANFVIPALVDAQDGAVQEFKKAAAANLQAQACFATETDVCKAIAAACTGLHGTDEERQDDHFRTDEEIDARVAHNISVAISGGAKGSFRVLRTALSEVLALSELCSNMAFALAHVGIIHALETAAEPFGALAHEHAMPLLLCASPPSSVLPAFKQLQDRAEQLTQRRRAIADVARQES